MKLNDIVTKWKEFVDKMNDKGVPLPMIRDPQTLEGSVSLTLVVISATLVVTGIVGKWSGRLGGIDMNNAMQFFYASCTLFFGHNWVNKGTAKVDDPDADQK
jgi:hypothetical protein